MQYFPPHLIIRYSCRIRWLSAFNLLSLEEGDIEDWRKEIHKLKHEYFERQVVLIFRLCPMHFCNKSNIILKIRAIKVIPFVHVEAPLSLIWSMHLPITLNNRWLRFLWYPLNRSSWLRAFLWYRQAVIETINVHVRAHEKNSGDTVRRLGTIIQSFFMPNRETAFAWPFVNGPVKVGTQGLFRPCLKTFVAPFLPARLTAPGSLRMVCSTLVCCCWKSCFPRGNLQIIQLSASR